MPTITAPESLAVTQTETNNPFQLYSTKSVQDKTAKILKEKESRPFDYHTKWTRSGLQLPTQRQAIREWLFTTRVDRFEDYLIDPRVKTVLMGVGWDTRVDIDASAILFDSHYNPVDIVWFRKLESACKSVKHSGDNLTGEGSGDDEVIKIDLDNVPYYVHHIALTVSIYTHDLSFCDIRNGYVRLLHGNPKHMNHVLCYCQLDQLSGNSMLLGQLTRKGGHWNFRTLGCPVTGRMVTQILKNAGNLECLTSCPSVAPSLRRIRVQVLKARNLSAKDRAGWFRREASSDPYYVISYKKKIYSSEPQNKTLNPVWKEHVFDLGKVSECETKALKIMVYDRDLGSEDDFEGMVWIPANALHHAGPGTHDLNFELGPSKETRYKNEEVSGEIFLRVSVEEVVSEADQSISYV